MLRVSTGNWNMSTDHLPSFNWVWIYVTFLSTQDMMWLLWSKRRAGVVFAQLTSTIFKRNGTSQPQWSQGNQSLREMPTEAQRMNCTRVIHGLPALRVTINQYCHIYVSEIIINLWDHAGQEMNSPVWD